VSTFVFGNYSFDPSDKSINVATGVATVDLPSLYLAAVDWASEPENMVNDNPVTAGGLFPLDDVGEKFTGLVVRLDLVTLPSGGGNTWRVKFADAAGPSIERRTVNGGDFLAEGAGNDPLLPSNFIFPVIELSTSPTYVVGAGGLNVTQAAQLAQIHGQVRRAIYVDTTAITNGNGYQQNPYNNFTDAVDDAETNGITKLILLGDATVDRQLKNFVFEGVGSPAITFNNQNVNGCEFYSLELDGTILAGSEIHAHDCLLRNNLTNINGLFVNCGFGGDLFIEPGSNTVMVDCYSVIPGLARPTVDTGGGGVSLSIRSYRGGLTVKGTDNAADNVTVSMAQGKLTLDASNTNGVISVRGVAQFTDASAGTTVDDTGLLNQVTIASTVWGALLSANTVSGSFGEYIQRKLLTISKFLALK
jgi:hypothetical protein